MPALRELFDFLCRCAAESGHGISDELARELERQIVERYQGEKVYIPRPDTSKKAAIVAAAKRLPTSVVAERYGVTRSWVYRSAKK